MTHSLLGATINGYQFLDEIGQGGMATVFRAHQLSMQRDVAIKMLPQDLLHQGNSLERFQQEASIVARLEHRAIVPVHEYGEHQGMPYLVMRYMDGGSVDDLLIDGPIPPENALAILEQIAPALDYAHREGVLHRDLKPSNILLDANGDAYITDFGIARILGGATKQLTTSGVVGTPAYMSPEQAQGKELDRRSDLYALGVVVFEMLTGRRPFEADTPYNVAVKHVTEPPPSPCKINPLLPVTVERVLLKALEKSCDRRYNSACEMVAALRQALDDAKADASATEPSLQHALQAALAQRAQAPPAPVSPPANLQLMPVYQPARSAAHPATPSAIRRRKRTSRFSDRVAWMTLGLLLMGGVVAAGLILGYYYLMGTGNTPTDAPASPDLAATAVFKLTATRAAIDAAQDASDSTGSSELVPITPEPAQTSLPTNTPRAQALEIPSINALNNARGPLP